MADLTAWIGDCLRHKGNNRRWRACLENPPSRGVVEGVRQSAHSRDSVSQQSLMPCHTRPSLCRRRMCSCYTVNIEHLRAI